MLASLMTDCNVHHFPLYIIQLFCVYISRAREMILHPHFYANVEDFPINFRKKHKKMLILCHGRNHGFPEIMHGPHMYGEDIKYVTVDINQAMWPHINYDVLHPMFFEMLKQRFGAFDYVVLFNCRCHTVKINQNADIMRNIREAMMFEGLLFVEDPSQMKVLTSVGFRQLSNGLKVQYAKLQRFPSFANILQNWPFVTEVQRPDVNITMFTKCSIEQAEKDPEVLNKGWCAENCSSDHDSNFLEQLNQCAENCISHYDSNVVEQNPACWDKCTLLPCNKTPDYVLPRQDTSIANEEKVSTMFEHENNVLSNKCDKIDLNAEQVELENRTNCNEIPITNDNVC